VVDGHYKVIGSWYRVISVKGDSAVKKETKLGVKYGDFGEADDKRSDMTSQSIDNLVLSYNVNGSEIKELRVVCDDGVKIATKGTSLFSIVLTNSSQNIKDVWCGLQGPAIS
jgi:hypothetical protein